MIGLVAALFCTLVVAGLCSYCMKIDFKWYFELIKPPFIVGGGAFSLLVSACYVSCILSVSRLVEHKHLFPSMIFFAILGLGAILFAYCFFTLKNLLAGLVFVGVVAAMSVLLLLRFLMKDWRIVCTFLPATVINFYFFLCVLYIAVAN